MRQNLPVGLKISRMSWIGEDARIDDESGILDLSIYHILEPDDMAPGWWVVDGFFRSPSVFEWEDVRKARTSDLIEFEIVNPGVWTRISLLLGRDPLVD